MRSRAEGLYQEASFVVRNVIAARRLPPLRSEEVDGVRLDGCGRGDDAHIGRIYAVLNGGRALDRSHRRLLRLTGRRLCLIARRQDARPIGCTFFYFNERDRREGTVHEGFIGVLPEFQGQRVGLAMRRHAIRVFAAAGLEGISSRISISNKASLDLSLRLGFQIVDRYVDVNTHEERAYLKLTFPGAAKNAT